MAKMTLDQLQEQLSGLGAYQKKTEDELRAQAESLYQGQYQQNLKQLQDSIYSSLAQQQRSTLDTGMQRSSYNQAQQAIIRGKGLEAQAQLGTDYATNVATTLLGLMDNEYERENAANQYRDQLLMALFEYGNKGGGGSGAAAKDAEEEKANTNPLDYLNKQFGGTTNSLGTSVAAGIFAQNGALNSLWPHIVAKNTNAKNNLNTYGTYSDVKDEIAERMKFNQFLRK